MLDKVSVYCTNSMEDFMPIGKFTVSRQYNDNIVCGKEDFLMVENVFRSSKEERAFLFTEIFSEFVNTLEKRCNTVQDDCAVFDEEEQASPLVTERGEQVE